MYRVYQQISEQMITEARQMVELCRLTRNQWKELVVDAPSDDTWNKHKFITSRVAAIVGPAADTPAFNKQASVSLDLKKKKLNFTAWIEKERYDSPTRVERSVSVVIEGDKVFVEAGMLRRKFEEIFSYASKKHDIETEKVRRQNEYRQDKVIFVQHLRKVLPEVTVMGDKFDTRDDEHKITIHTADNSLSFIYQPGEASPIAYIDFTGKPSMNTEFLIGLVKLIVKHEPKELE